MREAELGREYRDSVSGFVGLAVGRTTFLHHTPIVKLCANTGRDGELKERWIDESALEPSTSEPPPVGFGG